LVEILGHEGEDHGDALAWQSGVRVDRVEVRHEGLGDEVGGAVRSLRHHVACVAAGSERGGGFLQRGQESFGVGVQVGRFRDVEA
jgi:hypothetical protein